MEGACPLTARNLLVSFASGLVSVAASGLVAEEAWQGLRASWLRPRLGAAQQRVERHRRELQASEHELSAGPRGVFACNALGKKAVFNLFSAFEGSLEPLNSFKHHFQKAF